MRFSGQMLVGVNGDIASCEGLVYANESAAKLHVADIVGRPVEGEAVLVKWELPTDNGWSGSWSKFPAVCYERARPPARAISTPSTRAKSPTLSSC